MTEFITIAGATIPVVAQPHARLRHHLAGDDLQAIMGGDYSTNAYRILSVLIPELPRQIPEYVWEGFADQETLDRYRAGDRDAYDDEAAARAPDFDQIATAFKVAMKVNGGAKVGELIEMVRQVTAIGERGQAAMSPTTQPSPVMPGVNGG